jgi:hypothetical protein
MNVTVKVEAPSNYQPKAMSILALTEVIVTLDNTEAGQSHSLVVTDRTNAVIASMPACTGPCQGQLTLNVPPGRYPFHCEIHPEMVGRFTAE